MAQNTVCENESNGTAPVEGMSQLNPNMVHVVDVKMESPPDAYMQCDNEPPHKAEKRPLSPQNDASPRKKKKKKSMGLRMPPKNAVVALNEMRPGLEYSTVNRTGPVHQPIFTIAVEVDGQKFEGQGRSKKLAKHAAAEAVLRSFVQFKDAPEAQQMINMPMFNMDFTSDLTDRERAMFNVGQQPDTVNSGCLPPTANNVKQPGEVNVNIAKARAPVLSPDKSPVMLLNELEPGIKFECVSENGEPYAKFTMSVTVRGETFQGRGPSKKLGKAAAAKSALTKLYNMNFTPFSSPFPSPFASPLTPLRSMTSQDLVVLPQILADQIARLVTDRFAELIANDPTHSRRKVLAGIVMTTSPQMDASTVISVATGTKCINGEHMSETGTCLNDTHAEIIARRCLCDYLYSQLELLNIPEKSAESIFVLREDKKGYKLKEHVKFHLYINTAPCGDARIFSPHEAIDESVDKHPNRKARGQLRTKIESGEGTIPVKSSEGIQTWDGVMQGQRLLTMSCSDKIARWNVVGLQGSLLSHYVDPIYLDSIVLGSLFHPSHLYRAVCGRVETTVQGLPPPYRLNKPLLSVVTSPEVRQPGKAPNYSVNWTVGQEGPEIINSVTGKDEQGTASRLCKSSFFRRFARLLGHLQTRSNVSTRSCPRQYSTAKKLVQDYNMAKDQLLEAFKKADLGTWLKKPIEQDEFQLSDLDLL